eukprot:TRINITY_DN9396_c0_g1_i1.p1 TRINITY_DN9396_c0_g1~~TRINITY_DN9396_c0_g1_i1.p1  ORF type:complete len:142 (+),score=55.91 TRINITY_DN9396_c0_g1_i1:140-565(+)
MGLLTYVGSQVANWVMQSPIDYRLAIAICIIIWVSVFMSSFLDTIPYTLSMIPIIVHLSSNDPLVLPLAPLVWSLAIGVGFGSNTCLFGTSANILAVGLLELEGSTITFRTFLKNGLFFTIISTTVITLYMLLFHVVIPWY